MKCPTQVNCQGIVSSKEPKTLRGSGQNRQAVGCSTLSVGHTDIQTAGVGAGANPFVSLKSNIVNPTSRLSKWKRIPR